MNDKKEPAAASNQLDVKMLYRFSLSREIYFFAPPSPLAPKMLEVYVI
jgi:hypothetical protein